MQNEDGQKLLSEEDQYKTSSDRKGFDIDRMLVLLLYEAICFNLIIRALILQSLLVK